MISRGRRLGFMRKRSEVGKTDKNDKAAGMLKEQTALSMVSVSGGFVPCDVLKYV